MCGCDWNFLCSRCRPRHLVDLTLEGAATEPKSPAEEAYDRAVEYVDRVVLPAIKAAA